VKIAVSGKGGVGKTTIAAALAWFFIRNNVRTIAIDADSSPNLALTLGMSSQEADAILPISENKELIKQKTATPYPGVYSLSFTVDDIISRYAVMTPSGVPLFVMGTVHSMGSGCTCQANAVVRFLLHHLVVERDDAVILDMEAGVEHLGRGTAERVEIMIVVTDASVKSLQTAKRICTMAAVAGIRHVLLLGNRVRGEPERERIERFAREHGLEILGYVPFDREVEEAGISGTPLFRCQGSEALSLIESLGDNLLHLADEPGGEAYGGRRNKQ
jgi:CO dehydrogenase maturation factor